MKVTPWEVSGRLDYAKLIKDFGTSKVTRQLLKRMEKLAGSLHFMLSRNVFFSHRDLNWLLDKYENGEKFYLYTGRGPSGDTHIGHLLTWVLTKWLQDKFKSKVIFQITDDEKFLFNEKLPLEDAHGYAMNNALDFIALGFKPKNTEIIIDTDYSGTLYPLALPVAKKITASTVKAAFGLKDSDNVGRYFYTSVQAVPAILESVRQGKNVPCLIPHGIDQDPHFRVSRDVFPKLGYYKPAAIHSVFLPGLKGVDSKMSSSNPNSTVFTTEDPAGIRKKIMKHAFSGGQPSLKEQREKGADLSVDISYQWLYMFFESSDKKIKKIGEDYSSGSMTTGEIKNYLADKIEKFLVKHQKEREKARKNLHKYFPKK